LATVGRGTQVSFKRGIHCQLYDINRHHLPAIVKCYRHLPGKL
jgi:hypothetical protein